MSPRIAYFDCFSGISGNMILGALLDLGLPQAELEADLAKLPLDGYRLQVTPVSKHGLGGTYVDVEVSEQGVERHLADVLALIDASTLPDVVKERSRRIFERLAQAEARVHRRPVESVHFHEVGAVDAIVDIVGAVAGLERLGVEKLWCSPLNVGSGFVRASHGVLPVPAPATAELLKGAPTYSRHAERELVTPTGAAVVSTLAQGFGTLPPMTVQAVGYGAGKADLPLPNLLRVMVGEASGAGDGHLSDWVTVLETNLDDMNPQFFDYVLERLLGAGALDVYCTPVHMKKNRPGTVLTIISPPGRAEELLGIVFRETTTLGVRMQEMPRRCLERALYPVETPFGVVRVKVARQGDQVLNVAPEYEDCKRAALQHGVALQAVYDVARKSWEQGAGSKK